jgi:hypothetical protein|mmetsp:Transcript_41104/g.69051  ORF Transcript_41104/g.69051 Transcript_41104/m.69051 type:complete len:508 (+) Transcript_41104:303-1826(+)
MPRYFAGDGICQWWLILPGTALPPAVCCLGYDIRQMICGHLELRDLAAMVRSHWSIMEWVYDVLLIATPMGLVRNEKYEKLLWYCNKVSQILQQSSTPTVIDCDAPESDSDDHSAATHVPLQKPTGQCLPIRLLTIEAYCRERNTTTTGHRKCPAPNSQYLVKYKSHECDVPPIMKGREVVTNAAHALKPLCSLMGRALTQLWKLAIKVLGPREIIAMKDLLGPIRQWVGAIADRTGDFQWLELDIKEMFPEIPRDDIIPALIHIHDKIKAQTNTSSSLYFYLSKDGCRQMDTTTSSPRATHWRFSFSDLAHFVSFDTRIGDLFVFLSSVMAQNTGIPIGGSCSAQLASLVLIFREIRSPLPHILSDALWIRYRDNFLFLVFRYLHAEQNELLVQELQEALSAMTSMQITVEQQGQALKFLECWLTAPRSESPLGLPDYVNVQTPDCVPQVQKLMNPTAPTVEYMLQSLIPNWTRNAMHYRLTPSQATTNLQHLHRLFTTVGYTPSH